MKTKININMSFKDLVKHIENAGWTLERSNKHMIYSKPNISNKIILPFHGKGEGVSPGIIRKTMNIIEGNYYGGNNRLRRN